jgi:hypothetical protein
MCVCVCVCMYVSIHSRIVGAYCCRRFAPSTQRYLHIHTYIHTFVHTYIYIYTYIHTYIHTHIHKYIYTYIHTYIHTYTYIMHHTSYIMQRNYHYQFHPLCYVCITTMYQTHLCLLSDVFNTHPAVYWYRIRVLYLQSCWKSYYVLNPTNFLSLIPIPLSRIRVLYLRSCWKSC